MAVQEPVLLAAVATILGLGPATQLVEVMPCGPMAMLTNAINEGQTLGLPVRFEGTCAVASALSVTAGLDFGGFGTPFIGSILRSTNIAADIIDVNTTSAGYFHDFTMDWSAAANNGTQAFGITATGSENGGSRFERLTINGNVSGGITFVRASGWIISNSIIVGVNQGIIVANQNNADSGDSTIEGNLIESNGSAITWNSSGGLRVINNKINGSSMGFGFQAALAPGATTADIFITANSIEGISTSSGVGMYFARAGSTGGLGTVIISSNETSGNVGLEVPTDANGVWINNLVAIGNICVTCVLAGYSVDSSQGVVMSNNFTQGSAAATVNIAMGPHGMTSTNCVAGPNPKIVATAASNTGSCTAIAPN
jgi:hypothetical protein